MPSHDFITIAPFFSFALAVVATCGYLLGRRRRKDMHDAESVWRELKRAKTAIRELEGISQHVRRSLANHHSSILQFRERLSELGDAGEQDAWKELSEEAERMKSRRPLLPPTAASS